MTHHHNGNTLPYYSPSSAVMSQATSPSNGHVHSSRSVPADPILTAWQRYEALKNSEVEKNTLIEELIFRYEFISKANLKIQEELDHMKDLHQSIHPSKKAVEEENLALRKALDRDPFILVLIDADGMIFHYDLLNSGNSGGRQAAILLEDSVNRYVHEVVAEIPDNVRIIARLYANVKGLADTCHKAGVVPSPGHIEDFVRGFTQGRVLFDFIDVGPGKDRADEKITETFKLHTYDPRCRHIILGCSHDNGFARLLENYVYDEYVQTRITLLEGVPFEKELANLPFEKSRFGSLFRRERLQVYPQNLPPWSALNEVDLPLSRQVTRTPSESVTSTDAPVKPTINTWASKAAAAATKSESPQVPKATLAVSSPTTIPRNRKGQRVDPICNYDKAEVDRVRKLKMCNVHYLRKECPYGDKCTHKHDRTPTKAELETLRVVARMAACRNGSSCDDMKCIYGHRCQAPERLDKSKWSSADGGKTCIFGTDCVFPGELHNIDITVVKMVKV